MLNPQNTENYFLVQDQSAHCQQCSNDLIQHHIPLQCFRIIVHKIYMFYDLCTVHFWTFPSLSAVPTVNWIRSHSGIALWITYTLYHYTAGKVRGELCLSSMKHVRTCSKQQPSSANFCTLAHQVLHTSHTQCPSCAYSMYVHTYMCINITSWCLTHRSGYNS